MTKARRSNEAVRTQHMARQLKEAARALEKYLAKKNEKKGAFRAADYQVCADYAQTVLHGVNALDEALTALLGGLLEARGMVFGESAGAGAAGLPHPLRASETNESKAAAEDEPVDGVTAALDRAAAEERRGKLEGEQIEAYREQLLTGRRRYEAKFVHAHTRFDIIAATVPSAAWVEFTVKRVAGKTDRTVNFISKTERFGMASFKDYYAFVNHVGAWIASNNVGSGVDVEWVVRIDGKVEARDALVLAADSPPAPAPPLSPPPEMSADSEPEPEPEQSIDAKLVLVSLTGVPGRYYCAKPGPVAFAAPEAWTDKLAEARRWPSHQKADQKRKAMQMEAVTQGLKLRFTTMSYAEARDEYLEAPCVVCWDPPTTENRPRLYWNGAPIEGVENVLATFTNEIDEAKVCEPKEGWLVTEQLRQRPDMPLIYVQTVVDERARLNRLAKERISAWASEEAAKAQARLQPQAVAVVDHPKAASAAS